MKGLLVLVLLFCFYVFPFRSEECLSLNCGDKSCFFSGFDFVSGSYVSIADKYDYMGELVGQELYTKNKDSIIIVSKSLSEFSSLSVCLSDTALLIKDIRVGYAISYRDKKCEDFQESFRNYRFKDLINELKKNDCKSLVIRSFRVVYNAKEILIDKYPMKFVKI